MQVDEVVESLIKTESPEHCELVADAFEQWALCCKQNSPKQEDLRRQAVELRTAAKLAKQAREQRKEQAR